MKEDTSFKGFTPATIQFLTQLKENNYKEWFEENRAIYDTDLIQPFKSLIHAMMPAMLAIDAQFETRPHKILSRIYRDIRFSKNKQPYKTSMWMSFQRATTHWENFPGYFMELNTETCMYGMGLYAPKRKTMDTFREEMAYAQDSFREMTLKTQKAGFQIEGEPYKRPLANSLPDFFQPWMNRKNVYLVKTLPVTDPRLYSETLATLLIDDFMTTADLYRFMVEVAEA